VSKASCPRLFEVEARRDGRLGGAELARFERHMTACPACSREAQALEALAESLRVNRERPNELHVRRARTRLLAAFDRALVAPERRSTNRGLLLIPVAALAVLLSVAFLFWRARPERLSAVVRADSSAVWSERTEGETKKLIIERGELWIRIESKQRTARLLVVLPDGELEDTGTTFTVTVKEGRTARVAVEEGSVLLKIRGQPPVSISAGRSFTPEAQPAPPPTTPTPTPAAVSAPTRSPKPVAPLPTPDPSVEFRAALAALNAGNHQAAAAAFAGFVAKHPRDPRVEDATYLRIIALQRSGDTSAMQDAASDYLRRFPKGFRRAEVEGLL
jgi:hypothetical protein